MCVEGRAQLMEVVRIVSLADRTALTYYHRPTDDAFMRVHRPAGRSVGGLTRQCSPCNKRQIYDAIG